MVRSCLTPSTMSARSLRTRADATATAVHRRSARSVKKGTTREIYLDDNFDIINRRQTRNNRSAREPESDAEQGAERVGAGGGGLEEEDDDGDDDPTPQTFANGKAKKGKKGRGINSSDWDEAKRMVIKGLNETPGSLIRTVAQAPVRYNQLADTAQEWFKENCSPTTMATLLARLPTPDFDTVWTQDDENELLAQYPSGNPYRKFVEASDQRLTNQYWSMYRKVCRARGVFPEDIIGERTWMQYDEEIQITRKSEWMPSPNWSKPFSLHLEQLALCSPCRGNMSLLALFIRYTAACQLDDRRVVPLDDSRTGNRFFEEMTYAMSRAAGTKSLPDIGMETRISWTGRGLVLPWEAEVMREIEAVAFNEGAKSRDLQTSPFYRVNQYDLALLLSAFSKISDLGMPTLPHMGDRGMVISYARSAKDAPNDMEDLGKLRWPLVLAGIRFRERHRKISEQQAGEQPSESPSRSLQLNQRVIGGSNVPNDDETRAIERGTKRQRTETDVEKEQEDTMEDDEWSGFADEPTGLSDAGDNIEEENAPVLPNKRSAHEGIRLPGPKGGVGRWERTLRLSIPGGTGVRATPKRTPKS
ncbi:hypothetical protein F4780DRAFT_792492 [Xylariomycetidae sp. FL0641]|nr:hypothetical protein F4780DRAFT_792492 [Xylariomycetidae sp. FL0641]